MAHTAAVAAAFALRHTVAARKAVVVVRTVAAAAALAVRHTVAAHTVAVRTAAAYKPEAEAPAAYKHAAEGPAAYMVDTAVAADFDMFAAFLADKVPLPADFAGMRKPEP